MAEEISIVFHKNDTAFAQAIRDHFSDDGFSVGTGPNALLGSIKYQDIRHHTQISNASNIILMSKDLFRDNREFVELFAEKVSRDWVNIQIVSMDDEWTSIKSELIDTLKSVSFISVRKDKTLKLAARGIAKTIEKSIAEKSELISHFDHRSFINLLNGLFGSCSVLASENISKASISFTVCECKHPSGESERYLAI